MQVSDISINKNTFILLSLGRGKFCYEVFYSNAFFNSNKIFVRRSANRVTVVLVAVRVIAFIVAFIFVLFAVYVASFYNNNNYYYKICYNLLLCTNVLFIMYIIKHHLRLCNFMLLQGKLAVKLACQTIPVNFIC